MLKCQLRRISITCAVAGKLSVWLAAPRAADPPSHTPDTPLFWRVAPVSSLVLAEGTDNPGGLVKDTWGAYGLHRVDAYYGAKLCIQTWGQNIGEIPWMPVGATYLPLPTNDWYKKWISPFQNEIPTRMQACASPGLYFEVSPSEGISEARDALFLKAISVLRLTS